MEETVERNNMVNNLHEINRGKSNLTAVSVKWVCSVPSIVIILL